MTSDKFSKKDKRRTGIAAVVLGLSVAINLLFLIYAFIQKAEAETARNEVEAMRYEAVEMKKMAVHTEKALQDTIRVTQQLREELSKKKNK